VVSSRTNHSANHASKKKNQTFMVTIMINKILNNMSTKKKLLFCNIFTILFAVTALYGAMLFMLFHKLNFFRFTASSDFITIFVLAILFFVAYRILFQSIPKAEMQRLKKQPRRKRQPQTHKPTKPPIKPTGTWNCPVCNHLAQGNFCNECGAHYSDQHP